MHFCCLWGPLQGKTKDLCCKSWRRVFVTGTHKTCHSGRIVDKWQIQVTLLECGNMNDVNMFLSGLMENLFWWSTRVTRVSLLTQHEDIRGQPKVTEDRVSVQDIMTTFVSLYIMMETIQEVSQDVKKTERLQKILASHVQELRVKCGQVLLSSLIGW